MNEIKRNILELEQCKHAEKEVDNAKLPKNMLDAGKNQEKPMKNAE